MQLRDDLLKDISARNSRLGSLAFDLLNKANDEINDYKKIGDVRSKSTRLTTLIRRRDIIQSLKDAIDKIADKYIEQVTQADSNEHLKKLRTEMESENAQIEISLHKTKTEMETIA